MSEDTTADYRAWLLKRLTDPDRAARYLAEHELTKEQEPELYALALADIKAANDE